MVHIANGNVVDEQGRTVFLRGINFAADSKLPPHSRADDDPKSFVDSPCSLAEADEHFSRLQELGFNCIRFLYTWDALQPFHPDQYDEEYIDFAIAMVRKAIDYGFYVFMDPHQDIWSRFSGGSGAPLWTLHAVGFDHHYFNETHAAVIWDPEDRHAIKMQWASNYHRLVCQTMFTVFFAGPDYVPKCEINGINVGTYLTERFFSALHHFMERVQAADLGPRFLGWESINEPGHGLIGYGHLGRFPKSKTHVKLGTSPTPFQAMLLGQGIQQYVDIFKFTGFGLKRSEENRDVRPDRGTWLLKDDLAAVDAKYGWKRSWPGGCVWELHGVYNSSDQKLLKPYYFTTAPDEDSSEATIANDPQDVGERLVKNKREHGGDMHQFIDVYFVEHWLEFVKVVHGVNPEWLVLMQAPVNAPPPNMTKYYPDKIDESRTVYTPHFYDGLTLMLKRWRWLNVDAIGVMRELYGNPLPALRFGDGAIRRSFADQFLFMKDEGRQRLGNIPMLMSEIGIPYDMDKKDAYTSGYWDNQIRAMDANICGLEDAMVSYCIWCYAIHNTHRYGDNFAGEDLSIWSADDCKVTRRESTTQSVNGSTTGTISPLARSATTNDAAKGTTAPLARSATDPTSAYVRPVSNGSTSAPVSRHATRNTVASTTTHGHESNGGAADIEEEVDPEEETEERAYNGVRAAEAVVRPSPFRVAGDIEGIEFDIRKALFRLTVIPRVPNAKTEIYIPRYQFPYHSTKTSFSVTEGEFEVLRNCIIWDHGNKVGRPQSLEVRGVPHFRDSMYSYVEPFHRSAQAIANHLGSWAHRLHGDHHHHHHHHRENDSAPLRRGTSR